MKLRNHIRKFNFKTYDRYSFRHNFILFTLLLFLGSCKNSNNNSKNSISYWSSNNGGEILFSNWAVDEWSKVNGQLPIAYQPVPEGQSSEEILLAAVVAGTTPDIYSNIWQGLVEFYGQSGILVALDTLDGFMEFIQARCDEATIKEITASDGHIYQIPWKINPFMTIYNKRIIKELGIDTFPATYSAYLQAAKNYSQDISGNGYVDQWFGNTSVKLAWYQRLFNFYPLYLAASGGMPLIKDDKAVFNNVYGIGVMRFLQELYAKNYFSRQMESAGQDLFVAERYASKWTGSWEIEYLEKFKRQGFEYDFSPMPVPDGHKGPVYTYCDPKSMVIFATCKNPSLALEFIKLMLSEEGDLKFLKTTQQLPRRKNMDSIPEFIEFFDANPKLRIFADQAKHIKGSDNSVVLTEIFDIISQEYEACVLYAKKSPEQAMADAEKAVNILLSANPSKSRKKFD